ncbi:MAG TPA: sulfite exporter TauE/SafE family protein [Burkholderiales bacterium]|nr:sulfite exporter TauE/SafE family protein [Burkholderiales bacterium]
MTTYVLLALAAAAVGLFIGTVGVGGILLIPALAYVGGLTVHTAAATALFTFAFTGLLGTLLFQRRGSIDWRITVPVGVGAIVFSVLGAWASSRIDARPLALIIAAIIVLAGGYLLLPGRKREVFRDGRSHAEQLMLLGIGAVSGFGSGLSGAGGPLFSVPMMVLAGFVPLASVGTSQVLQIVAAAFGTAGNLAYGHIDFAVAGWITAFELAGVVAGVRLAHAVGVETLRRLAAGLCIAVGALMLWRNF